MRIIEEVNKIVTPVYLVGGSVRDSLIGNTPKDFDFATPLSPEEIKNAIQKAGRKAYCVGERFGTIGFKVEIDGKYEYVEITTFRTEKYIRGSRKPEVSFVRDITADLSRRDFTMNAIAIKSNKLIDPFNGAQDLKDGLIRSVGNASHRFREDPLRMLRAARFMSQLGFRSDEGVIKGVKNLNYKILEVSRERWVMELDKLLVGDYVEQGLQFLMDTRLINYMIPELSIQNNYDQNSPHHGLVLWDHTRSMVGYLPKDITLRWAGLLHDIAKPYVRTEKEDRSNYIKHDMVGAEMIIKLAKYLKWSNDRTKQVSDLVLKHLNDDSPLRDADKKAR